ncbi:MAG: zinc ribbon domain-containing protein [bacterium]
MVIRNLIILLIDVIFGALVGLELKFSLLGKLFIEPYRSLMPAAWGVLLFLWLLAQIPVMRKWWWPALGALLSLIVAAIIPLWEKLANIDPGQLYAPSIALLLLLGAVILSAVPVEKSFSLAHYAPIARSKRITLHSAPGPYWLIFSLALGIIFGITLYHNWIPSRFLSFLNSPELLRLTLYLFYAALSGYISLSPGWGAFSSALFVFTTEFTFQFLYTAYASFQQLVWEFTGIFMDPARVSAPITFLLLAFIWGWFAGHYSRTSLILKEAKVEAELEIEAPGILEGSSKLEEQKPEEKKTCQSCGASIDPQAQFCPSCGAKQGD